MSTVQETILNTPGLDALTQKVEANPLMTIHFYPYGIVLRHNTPHGTTEKIVSPDDLARLLHNRPFSWSSGLLNPNTIYVGESAGYRVLAEFRKKQPTGIWLDGSTDALRVPLPPLVLIRWLAHGKPVEYHLFAVKRRPQSLNARLYAAPLPNTYSSGGICWGNIAKPDVNQLAPDNLELDWKLLLGTGFNDHSVHSKSKKYNDIRKVLVELDAQKSTQYPLDDLVETGHSLQTILKTKEPRS